MSDKIKLLIIDDDDMFRQLLEEKFSRSEFEATACGSAEAAMEMVSGHEFDVGIIDIQLPGMNGLEVFRNIRRSQPYFEAIILTGAASVDTAIDAMKQGVYDYLTKPCKLFELELMIRKAYEKKMLAQENARLKSSVSDQPKDYAIVGDSDKAQELRENVKTAAQSNVPVLITGEPGSGKEFAARAIHQQSKGNKAPFITVECGVYAHGILENQLFGHEQGAFAGATDVKNGWLAMADGGTICLKDVNELHPSTQVGLLRYLETGTYQRVGGTTDLYSTARVIAATEKDLKEAMVKNKFREDLYYKLNVINIDVPPLRDRKEDIAAIIEHFLAEQTANGQPEKKFSNKAVNAMLKYDWPANVRELLNVIERAYLIAKKNTIQARDIPISVDKITKKAKDRHLLSLEEVERDHILYVLNAMGGNISRAARTLGISRPKLYRKINQYKASTSSD